MKGLKIVDRRSLAVKNWLTLPACRLLHHAPVKTTFATGALRIADHCTLDIVTLRRPSTWAIGKKPAKASRRPGSIGQFQMRGSDAAYDPRLHPAESSGRRYKLRSTYERPTAVVRPAVRCRPGPWPRGPESHASGQGRQQHGVFRAVASLSGHFGRRGKRLRKVLAADRLLDELFQTNARAPGIAFVASRFGSQGDDQRVIALHQGAAEAGRHRWRANRWA